MATPRKGGGKSGTKKYGRNKVKCERYRREHRREKNKLRRLRKLVKTHPNDKQLKQAIRKFEELI